MVVAAAINSRGQLTLPANMRRQLGLMKGGHVSIEEKDGTLVLRPAAMVEVEMYTDERIAEFMALDAYEPGEREAWHKALGRVAR